MAETSTKPYLIRAIHEWCADNGYRPFIAVAVDERTIVPREYVRSGEIVLNVSAEATHRLQLGNERIEFEARFNGVARQVSVPVENVSAIYAAENGHGMAFDVPKPAAEVPALVSARPEAADSPPVEGASPIRGAEGASASHDAGSAGERAPAVARPEAPVLSIVPQDAEPGPPEPSPPAPGSPRPRLTRVK